MSSLQSGNKRCTECGEIKPLKEFHKTSRKYGNKIYTYHHAKCNECRNTEGKRWNANNKDRIAIYNREYVKKNFGKIRSYYKRKIDD